MDMVSVKPQLHHWNKNARYRSWVKQRDRALEKMHTRAQLEAADVMRGLLSDVVRTVHGNYHSLHSNAHGAADTLEAHLKMTFQLAASKFHSVIIKMRARTYCLAKASEAEIIAQLRPGKLVTASVTKSAVHEQSMGG